MFTIGELERAAEAVHEVLPETPQIRWPLLCQQVKADVWVKQENHTPIGAFKIRGAKMLPKNRIVLGFDRSVASPRRKQCQTPRIRPWLSPSMGAVRRKHIRIPRKVK
jgi:threonine dehydratase